MEKIEKIMLVLIFLEIFIVSWYIIQSELRFITPTPITTTSTTTTTLPCIVSHPAITPNCTRDCCLDEDIVFMSADLNGAPSCSQADTFYINLESGNDCIMGAIAHVNISAPFTSVSSLWFIPPLPSNCLGQTVQAQYASLWRGEPEKGIKISQEPDPKASGNVTFCAPQKVNRPSEAFYPIEHGEIMCFYERVVLPFYNPHENLTLENIQVILQKDDGEDISKLSSLLKPQETKVLILENLQCPMAEKEEDFLLRWTCGNKFYETTLGEEAGKTEIVEMDNVTSGELPSERGYPLHPTLKDCEKLTTSVKNFCYDDVAEITGQVEICERISDWDIRKHCIARVTLNSSLCEEIDDEGLKRGCLESIEMKTEWLKLESGNFS